MNLEEIKKKVDKLKDYDDCKSKYEAKVQSHKQEEFEKIKEEFISFFEKDSSFNIIKNKFSIIAKYGSFEATITYDIESNKNSGIIVYAILEISKKGKWSIKTAIKTKGKVTPTITVTVIKKTEEKSKEELEYEQKVREMEYYQSFVNDNEPKEYLYQLIEGNTNKGIFESIEKLLESL